MNKKMILTLGVAIILVVVIFSGVIINNFKENNEVNKIVATVLEVSGDNLTVRDSNDVIYTFIAEDISTISGDVVELEFVGYLDKDKSIQDNKIINYSILESFNDNSSVPSEWLDGGIFSDYYDLAYDKLQTMSMSEKIAQILLVRYPDENQVSILENYQFGGYVFFAKDFSNKTKSEVQSMINSLQDVSKIPILTAVDEEGGEVVRVSSNPNLANERFKSPSELYKLGGFDLIKEDTIKKSNLLNELGINLNLAPVVDVSTDSSDYMYSRALGEGTELTSVYAKTVIEASKGLGVSYTLKHFPGYGNNADTHYGTSVDNRTYEDISSNDLPPFKAGIDAQAEAVLVSHNIVSSIDADNPASLSIDIHNLLRDDLDFTGIIITDDLAMGSVSTIDDAPVEAILAGNDLIITTDYEGTINSIKTAINNQTIDESLIDKLAFRVLAWKYYKGLMFENQK